MKPLEWWEEAQLNILEHLAKKYNELGALKDVERFRKNPDEWRKFRETIKKK